MEWRCGIPRKDLNLALLGNIDRWTGLGIIIDTFDNDGRRDNPQIYGVYNDRSFAFNPVSDGKENVLGICQANVRQIAANPETKFVKLLVRLKDKTLFVAYDNSGIASTAPGWTDCFTAQVPIEDQPTGYYLGLTAETGGLSDFHDIKSVTTWSFREPTKLRDNAPDKDEPLDSRKRVEKEPKDYKPRKADGEDPAYEIVKRLIELEKKDEAFSTSLEQKFKDMQQKLESMERDQIQTLTRVQQGLESIRSAVDVNRIEELKRDIKSALESLNVVQTRINTIETHVEGTKKKLTPSMDYMKPSPLNFESLLSEAVPGAFGHTS